MRTRLAAIIVLLAGTSVLAAVGAGPTNSAADRPELGPGDPVRGLVYAGLRRAAPESLCDQAFELPLDDGGVLCSHGPDPAPDGVDVRAQRGDRHAWSEPKPEPTFGPTATTGPVTCVGNGTDGPRVQAMYVRASDKANRLDSNLLASIRAWAGAADAVFSASAAETGGDRRLRWVTNSNCELDVLSVKLPTSTGDDTLTNTINALRNLGYNRSDRKYAMWVDANVYCGIATIYADDKPDQSNLNNGYAALYARMDTQCWGQGSSVEAHEIMHTLGGVQRSAPHGTANSHCTDEYDRLCYRDAGGVVLTYPCSDPAGENRFDCRHDDYYHTNPPAGSYLATHWNTANSAWLYQPSGEPPPPPEPEPEPGEPVTETFTGTAGSKNGKQAVTVGAGTSTFTLTFNGGGKTTVKIKNSSGTTVVKRSGRSPVQFAVELPAGTYKVVISSSTSISWTLEVTHPPA